MSHLTKQERCKIENLLNARVIARRNFPESRESASTIRQEIRKHRHEDEEVQKRKMNFCSQRKSCCKKNLCEIPPGNCAIYCRSCKIIVCSKLCSSYVEDVCSKSGNSPYVCNGCKELNKRHKRKFFYTASKAMKDTGLC